jgi:hypothetical protein
VAWFKKVSSPLPKAPGGLGDFWATVHVVLFQPMPAGKDPHVLVHGYHRSFGIRAVPSRVPELLAGVVSDGRIEWDETEWRSIDPATLARAIRKRIQLVAGEGLWYSSGRAYYPEGGRGDGPN